MKKINSTIYQRMTLFGLAILLSLVSYSPAFGQCTNSYELANIQAPTSSTPVIMDDCNLPGDYNTINNCQAGTSYEFVSEIPTDFLTIRQGTPGGTVLGTGTGSVTVTATATGPLYMHINTDPSCGEDGGCRYTTVACTSCTAPPSGECLGSSSYLSAPAPYVPNSPVVVNYCTWGTEYSWITNAVAGTTYRFENAPGGNQNYFTIREGTYDGPVIATGFQPITATPSISGNVYIHAAIDASCTTATGTCNSQLVYCETCIAPPSYEATACSEPYVQAYGQPGTVFVGTGTDSNFPITLPFTFTFFGNSFVSGSVGSDGWMAFGGTRSYNNVNLPTTLGGAALYPFWDNLGYVDANAGIYYRTDGAAPNRIYTVEWYKASHFSPVAGQDVTFQIQLFEGSNLIRFKYLDVVFGGSQTSYDYGASATVGLEDVVSSPRPQTLISFNQASLSDGQCIQFAFGSGSCDPQVSGPVSASTGVNDCLASVQVPFPGFDGGCADDGAVRYQLDGGSFVSFSFPYPANISVSGLETGTHTITWEVLDTSGVLVGTAEQTVTIEDLIPPVVNCPGDMVITLSPGECSAVVNYTVTATDNCGLGSGGGGGTTFVTLVSDPGTANNGLFSLSKVLFDVNNTSGQPLHVTGVGLDVPNATTVRIYAKSGTYVGSEGNPSAWTLMATSTVEPPYSGSYPGNGTISSVVVDLILPTGVTGVALETDSGHNYTNGTGSNQTFSDANITISLGASMSGAGFPGGANAPRCWRGYITYETTSGGSGSPDIVQTEGLESGAEYGLGTVQNCFEVEDAAGNVGSCCFTVEVVTEQIYYADNDGDGYGDPASGVQACTQPAGYVDNDLDCDDSNPDVHPGATEVCNGIDDNCDGEIDEGLGEVYFADADGDGYGDPESPVLSCSEPAGYVVNALDCDDTNASVYPGATEICNGIDDNCDGEIDEGVKNTYYADNDGDGFGDPASSLEACDEPAGYVNNDFDCDDNNPDVNPGAEEICFNGIDDNCDGEVDEFCTVCPLEVSLPSCETVYVGYGPAARVTLTPTVSGAVGSVTYTWSTGATTPSISVSPTTTTVYTVAVKDELGCIAEASVTVEAVDIRCNDVGVIKIWMCFNGGDMCVQLRLVPYYLSLGATLGQCGTNDTVCVPYQPFGPGSGSNNLIGFGNSDFGEFPYGEQQMEIFPNPATDRVNVVFSQPFETGVVKLFDLQGKMVFIQKLAANTLALEVPVSNLIPGTYILNAIVDSGQFTQKIVIE